MQAPRLLGNLFVLILISSLLQAQTRDTTSVKTLIIFFDGLRPDYITPQLMPNLHAFSKRNSYGLQHHSVFPTVTRVNASSYATGSYPGTHGILGNTIYLSQADAVKTFNTGEASEMIKAADLLKGRLLTAQSLGEILREHGKDMMVFSSGSSGQAFLQNHTVTGAIVNTSVILPDSKRERIISDLGAPPASSKPNTRQHTWITNALIRYGLSQESSTVNALWYSDPDASAHADGIGSPLCMESLKAVDSEFGRVIAAIDSLRLTNRLNIMISTDHGFVTHQGKLSLVDFLIKQGFKKSKESDDVIVAEGALYVKNHDPSTIKKIVSALQAQEWVGAIFTKAKAKNSLNGVIKGTMSFDAVHWDHPERTADILVTYQWNEKENAAGYKGTSYAPGVAGHGSLSPYEVHIPLIVSGPAFRKQYTSQVPTSNVDIVPTLLYLHNIPIPAGMNGRVLSELMTTYQDQRATERLGQIVETSCAIPGGTYRLTLHQTVIGKHRYVDYVVTTRN